MSWNALVAANQAAQAGAATGGGSPWVGSPFYWLKGLANLPRGDGARQMVETMLAGFGYGTSAASIAQSFQTKGHVIKVKLSMGWSGSKTFKFQQIEDDPYTDLAMLGLEPADAWFWLCPKAVAWANASGQHRTDSRWIQLAANRAPAWLKTYGGHIASAQALCLAQLGTPP